MRKIVKYPLMIAGILVAAILGVYVSGSLLPEEHRASRTLRLKQSPSAIWDTINDHANEAKWRSDVASVTQLPDRQGQPVWQENYKDGNTVSLATTESTPPTRLVREIADVDGPFSGRWEIEIQPTTDGSSVRITEIGRVPNPIFRFVSKYVIGHTTQMEKYLISLAAKFGEPPTIE